MNHTSEDTEYAVLQHIAENDSVAQRALADHTGISLGMTNAIVRRLAKKGLLKISKINERKLMYAVTPDGFDALARRSVRYVRRTIRNVVEYREAVAQYLGNAKSNGRTEVVLLGESDIAFIIEYYCLKLGLTYRVERSGMPPTGGDSSTLLIAGERLPSEAQVCEEVDSITSILAGS